MVDLFGFAKRTRGTLINQNQMFVKYRTLPKTLYRPSHGLLTKSHIITLLFIE